MASSLSQPIRDALTQLGVDRLTLSVHDLMLPGDGVSDLGRGAPASHAAFGFLEHFHALGFNALQVGPEGETARANPSPYDSTAFARNPSALAADRLLDGELAGLVTRDELEAEAAARPGSEDRAQHPFAHDATRRLLALAWSRARADPKRSPLLAQVDAFRRASSGWIERDALFAILAEQHQTHDPSRWPELDRRLWDPPERLAVAARARRAGLEAQFADRLSLSAFQQWAIHEQHAEVQSWLRERGITLYGDLQIGFSPRDAWSFRAFFLRRWLMGAPPSRTTPHGQPWGYPILNPLLTSRRFNGGEPPALALVRLRIDKALAEHDGLRVDHPHGWVCPWVYDAAQPRSEEAVNRGTRLFESPDVADLAQFAIARADQLARDKPRFDDGWVRTLDGPQVDLYAELTDEIVASAKRAGRPLELLLWELLSTQPYPLEQVLRRQGLGRFRVTQKVRLDNPNDNYRAEHALSADWVMVGNHDTEPIWTVVERWDQKGELRRRADEVANRLRPGHGERLARALARSPRFVAQAQFADLFASKARNVLVFVSDLLGETRVYNVPGVVHPDNWTLRVPRDYRDVHERRRLRGEALNLPFALALALESKGSGDRSLIDHLLAHASPVLRDLLTEADGL